MSNEHHEEIAKSLFRESNDALFLFDTRDHRLVDLNPVAIRLTGRTRKEALQLTLWDVLTSEEPDGVRRVVEAYQRTGFFHSREGYFLTVAGGDPVPVNVSVSRIHTKPEPLGLATVRDVREARQALAMLDRFFRLSPALFAIMEEGPRGLRFVRLNAEWERALGVPQERLMAMSPLELVHPEDVAATEEAIRSLASGERMGFEHRVRRGDGEYLWVSWNAALAEGRIHAVGQDVTGRRRAAALEREKERAEASSRAKSEFLARVSHEVRTPLTSILGSSELLLGDEAVARAIPGRMEELRAIHESGRHLLALVDDVLDLSAIESGRVRIEARACDPVGLARGLVESMRKVAEGRRLSLEFRVGPGVPATVTTDPLRLRQILFNLVGNALKYTERGGVAVEVGLAEGERVAFRVADTGPGLAEDVRAHLFEPFFRGEEGPAARAEGTGLGLAISRRLAADLGGALEVETAAGVGTTFAVLLPLGGVRGEAAAVPAPVVARVGESELKGCRILLAEDHAANRRVIATRLQMAGAEVEAVGDGRAAVERATGEPGRFDVVLLDMQMPVMDGTRAVELMRAGGYRGPVVALTAHASEEDRAESLRLGCDAYLSKPFAWGELVALVGRLRAGSEGGGTEVGDGPSPGVQ
jgi:PAS domain S-box-containing protein